MLFEAAIKNGRLRLSQGQLLGTGLSVSQMS